MKPFIEYLIDYSLLTEDKKTDSINRYFKIHKDDATVQQEPERARTLIGHALSLAGNADESKFITKQFLTGRYKMNEDEESAKSLLRHWRKGKASGAIDAAKQLGSFSDHDTAFAHLRTIPGLLPQQAAPDTSLARQPHTKIKGLEDYHIGTINSDEYGPLSVYNFRKKDMEAKGPEEIARVNHIHSATLPGRDGDEGECTWCTRDHPETFASYASGTGFFSYINPQGKSVLSHGFGDRGIVHLDNTVSPHEKLLKKQTAKLLQGDQKTKYEFFNTGSGTNLTFEQQKGIYDELEPRRRAPHFLAPHVNVHPDMMRILHNDVIGGHGGGRVAEHFFAHKDLPDDILQNSLKSDNSYERRLALKNPKIPHADTQNTIMSGYRALTTPLPEDPNTTMSEYHPHYLDRIEKYREQRRVKLDTINDALHATENRNHNIDTSIASVKFLQQYFDATGYDVGEEMSDDEGNVHSSIKHLDQNKFHKEMLSSPDLTDKEKQFLLPSTAQNKNSSIAMSATQHPLTTTKVLNIAAGHKDPAVVMSAIKHPEANEGTLYRAVSPRNFHGEERVIHPSVMLEVLKKSPKGDSYYPKVAAEHTDPAVVMAGLEHPAANNETTHSVIRGDINPALSMAALTSKHADAHTTIIAAKSQYPEVALAALTHKHSIPATAEMASWNQNPQVALAALKKSAGSLHHGHVAQNAAQHPDPEVALAAMKSVPSQQSNWSDKIFHEFITGAGHKHPDVVQHALDNFTEAEENKEPRSSEYVDSAQEVVRRASGNQNPRIVIAAMNHPFATLSSLRIAGGLDDLEVRKISRNKIDAIRQQHMKNGTAEMYESTNLKIKPFIQFLTEDDLTLEYHDTLNPKIWDGDELKPEVQAKLLQIAKKWATFAKIPDFAVTDIILVGGNANYNWTKFSDLDLHVVVNRKDLADCPDLLDDYLQNKKQLWALVHDITIYGHDVELYAQDKETPYPKKQGVYSIKNKKWIVKPKYEDVDFRGPALLAKVKQYTERIDTLISTNAEDESFSKLKEKFKNMRSSGLKKIGEFSMENLVFKELRNRGVIDRMSKYLQSRQDQKLSLNENYPFQIQIHNKKTNELVDVMQLNSETKTEAMGKGLRGLQDAKRNFKSKYPEAGDVADHQFSVRYPHDSSWITPTS